MLTSVKEDLIHSCEMFIQSILRLFINGDINMKI